MVSESPIDHAKLRRLKQTADEIRRERLGLIIYNVITMMIVVTAAFAIGWGWADMLQPETVTQPVLRCTAWEA